MAQIVKGLTIVSLSVFVANKEKEKYSTIASITFKQYIITTSPPLP